METKISIILPIYNAGVFLAKCLDSLVNQTLKDIEIICVLDCPTDGSDKIAKQYSKIDNRIVIIENERNMHIGNSRNIGMKVAKGKYIGFMDHDDFCEVDMYEQLYILAEKKNTVLAGCNFDKADVNNILSRRKPYINQTKETNTCHECIKQVIKSEIVTNAYSIWNKIFSRSFIEKHQIQFVDTNLISGEDILFNTSMFLLMEKYNYENAFTEKVLYHHRSSSINTGVSPKYVSNWAAYRNELSLLVKKYYPLEDINSYYVGDIRAIYRVWRESLKNTIATNIFKNIYDYPEIVNHIIKGYSIYRKELTIPKNVFGLFMYLFLRLSNNKIIEQCL